jgi:hypothetical protein
MDLTADTNFIAGELLHTCSNILADVSSAAARKSASPASAPPMKTQVPKRPLACTFWGTVPEEARGTVSKAFRRAWPLHAASLICAYVQQGDADTEAYMGNLETAINELRGNAGTSSIGLKKEAISANFINTDVSQEKFDASLGSLVGCIKSFNSVGITSMYYVIFLFVNQIERDKRTISESNLIRAVKALRGLENVAVVCLSDALHSGSIRKGESGLIENYRIAADTLILCNNQDGRSNNDTADLFPFLFNSAEKSPITVSYYLQNKPNNSIAGTVLHEIFKTYKEYADSLYANRKDEKESAKCEFLRSVTTGGDGTGLICFEDGFRELRKSMPSERDFHTLPPEGTCSDIWQAYEKQYFIGLAEAFSADCDTKNSWRMMFCRQMVDTFEFIEIERLFSEYYGYIKGIQADEIEKIKGTYGKVCADYLAEAKRELFKATTDIFVDEMKQLQASAKMFDKNIGEYITYFYTVGSDHIDIDSTNLKPVYQYYSDITNEYIKNHPDFFLQFKGSFLMNPNEFCSLIEDAFKEIVQEKGEFRCRFEEELLNRSNLSETDCKKMILDMLYDSSGIGNYRLGEFADETWNGIARSVIPPCTFYIVPADGKDNNNKSLYLDCSDGVERLTYYNIGPFYDEAVNIRESEAAQ